MKRFFYFIIISFSFYACKPGIPKDIIQPDKMQNVLVDIHIVDGYIGTLPGVDTAKKVGSAFYKGVYKKFDIDSALYAKSINYYYRHPDLMKKMYDTISFKLNILKEKNPSLVVDHLYIFKGLFDKASADSITVDVMLNRKYNSKLLKKYVFINLNNAQPNTQINTVPTAQPTPTATAAPIKEPVATETLAEPVKALPEAKSN